MRGVVRRRNFSAAEIARMQELVAQGVQKVAIAARFGMRESTLHSLLKRTREREEGKAS